MKTRADTGWVSALAVVKESMSQFFCLRETEALTDFIAQVKPLPAESVTCAQALGRVPVFDLLAPFSLPRCDCSTRDGFAVRSQDLGGAGSEHPVRLRINGVNSVGLSTYGKIGCGEARRVVTGSPLPVGADAVVMEEDAELCGSDLCSISVPVSPGQYILPQGADIRENDLLVRSSVRLDAHKIALLSQFFSELSVHRRPVVGILATGDEFLQGRIFPNNALLVHSLCQAVGAVPICLGIVSDDFDRIRTRLASVLAGDPNDCDCLVVIGGSSRGERDCTTDAITSLSGCRLCAQDQKVSSGRPFTLARIDEKIVWGMPGNALSLSMIAQVLLVPYLCRRMGLNTVPCQKTLRVRLGMELVPEGSVQSHYPVTLNETKTMPFAFPVPLGTGKTSVLRDMAGWITLTDMSSYALNDELDMRLFL